MSADRLRLFYTDSSLIEEDSARIEGDEAAHLARVLRLQPGDRCRIATESGVEYLVELTDVSARITETRILERLPPRPSSPLTLTLGLPLIKGDRFEWVLEKGTELGVDRFVPLKLSHCEVRIPENKKNARTSRWQRTVSEAAKQCDRIPPPTVIPPTPLDSFLRETETCDLKLVAWLGEGRRKVSAVLSEAAEGQQKNRDPLTASLLLGPEGDLTSDEVSAACKKGYIPVDLGPRILRADTAPITLVTLVQFFLGDIDSSW